MSLVNILNVAIYNNPAPFLAGFEVEITFECIQELQEDLDFSLIFVGSSTTPGMDQEIDSLLVGPVPVGINKFMLQSQPINPELLNPADVMDYTAVFLKCQYRKEEFLRCSYLVKAEYVTEELNLNPPEVIDYNMLQRMVSANPKVTRFPIPWDGQREEPPPQPEADSLPAIDLSVPFPDEEEDNEDDEDDDEEEGAMEDNMES